MLKKLIIVSHQHRSLAFTKHVHIFLFLGPPKALWLGPNVIPKVSQIISEQMIALEFAATL